MRAKRRRLVVTGFMGGMPIGGVIWQHIHYIVGLQQLGHEVYYIEDSARVPYDPVAGMPDESGSYAVSILATLAKRFGFEERWAFRARCRDKAEPVGLSAPRILDLYRGADAILNICGAQELHDDILTSDRLIYVESDPGEEQIKIDNGDPETLRKFRRYDALFTFGESIPTSEFSVPLHGLNWRPTRQPVVTQLWDRPDRPPSRPFSSIANWNTGGQKDIHWQGETYLWSKTLEFLKFRSAPKVSGENFELATSVDDATRAGLEADRWMLSNPGGISVDIDQYKDFIQSSKGEFTVAKDQYVRLNTGWFSDRSACYLAAGRPVITQETGFTRHIDAPYGLVAYSDLTEVADAVAAVNADYDRHCRGAREVAKEYFEATKVLAALLETAGV